ncbi:MAG: hypothetical protein CYG60_07295 [Actinobacteria bacterium]|nr:MAG: hypothetical protein CYG60_07295 [Actinomycetota bacterium]
MAFPYSDLNRRNAKWMKADNTCGTLSAVKLAHGRLRGLRPFEIKFEYPIAAIAGENGAGKSTLLAMAACAFHNSEDGFKLSDRANSYYTFSDFFVQSNDEVPPSGIAINYEIRHDRWRGADPGPRWQTRKKKVHGKWSDYKTRVKRNVVYFGLQRIVPHYERTTYKANRRRFQLNDLDADMRNRIRKIAGRILGRNYSDFELHEHAKYSLPIASWSGLRYSGFNMGAGESAVFGILTALFAAGRGSLIIIDEIELGLHEKAQRCLIRELDKLCDELHCQIICSTHSHLVLQSLPPEGRFFIETRGEETVITPGISPDYACGKLGGRNTSEIDIFVEDDAAKSILEASLPLAVRERIHIHYIGSSEAVLRQLAARYLERRDNCLAILDGDKRKENGGLVNRTRKNVDTRYRKSKDEINEWISSRLYYLPGNEWPERWLIESAQAVEDKSDLLHYWGLDSFARLGNALDNALLAGKHREFYTLHEEMQQPQSQIACDLARFVNKSQPENMENLVSRIEELL